MRARLVTSLAGDPSWSPGDIVSGQDAVSLCAAGFAVPIVEEEKRETATTAPKSRKKASKLETREAPIDTLETIAEDFNDSADSNED